MSLQAKLKVKIAIAAIAGLINGKTILVKDLNGPKPSISAASNKFPGIAVINWRVKKIL